MQSKNLSPADSHPVSAQTARRYVLGRQGLWPGRRWKGREGTKAALCQMEAVQIDPIHAIARNHDLVLWSRVADYAPALLDRLLYQDRLFFDFGSILMIYPMEELAVWQAIMRRMEAKWEISEPQAEVCIHVLNEIKSRGPLGGRDFTERERIRGGFNKVKDTGMALWRLWYTGKLMTHSRRGFDRIHDLFENIAGRPFEADVVAEAEAEQFLAGKALRDAGCASAAEWARRASVYLHRRVTAKEAPMMLERRVEEGELARIQVESRSEIRYLPAADLPLLQALEAGKIPDAWKPLQQTTEEEVVFLAPLDNVIWDRARTQALFGFDYVWEVYKPAAVRRWGYYTLPILWGDRLTARLAPRLNRKTRTLQIEGFWLEDSALDQNEAFIAALSAGLQNFARFHHAQHLDLTTIQSNALCQAVNRVCL